MNLTEEQLEEVERLAGLFFHPADIMTIIGIPIHDTDRFFDIIGFEKENPLFQSYHKGRLTANVELRQAVKQAALNGSNPAQNMMVEFFNKSKI